MNRKPLALVLLTFTLLVLMHNAATPIFEAPDEIWHYAYVRWLSTGHGLPAMDNNDSGANQEVAQPPLYYTVAALLSAPFNKDDLNEILWGNPHFGYQAPGTMPDNKNMLIHTAVERWPWRGAVLTLHMMRLASLFFGLLTVTATWGLGYETFGTFRGARITAMLIAFHPQFVFICSFVSNDSAAAALSTMALWAIARVLRRGLTLQRAVISGALVGLAALTKTSAILLLPLGGLALMWAARPGTTGKTPPLQIPIKLSAFGATALLVGGWWYMRNSLLYGDPLGISNHAATPWGRPAPVPLFALAPEIPRLLYSFWGAYGWGHVTWPAWVYWLLGLSSLSLLFHSIRSIVRTPRHSDGIHAQSISRISLILALLWCGGILAALLHWMQQVEAPHGRLLFPALGAWALLLANGFTIQETRDRLQKTNNFPTYSFAHSLILIIPFTLSTLAPGTRILATFMPPRLYSAEMVTRTLSPTVIDYAKQARLLGVAVETERAAPGKLFAVKACWQALAPMQQDYTVFIHLIGPENSRVAERHTYPGLGRFPTSLWPVESEKRANAFCDIYHIRIEPWAEGPLLYQLQIGLFDASTGERLSSTLADGRVFEPPAVGAVSVIPESVITEPAYPLNVTLADQITLHGYDKPSSATAGETITVTLHWEALSASGNDLTAFVHLWRPGDATPLVQHDSPPRQGWYPTTVWQAGDRVLDTHPLNIPAKLPPGDYPLWTGFYHTTNGVRLTAIGPEGHYLHYLIPLGTLNIE